MTSRQHTVIATALVIIGLYLMKLTSVEIQPSPEGIIAVRGESIALFDAWGETWVSPLTSGAAALGVSAVGATPLAVRWLAIISVLVVLSMTYLIARRSLSFHNAVLSMGVVGTSIPFITYGRQATDVIPFVACMLLTLWGALMLRDKIRMPLALGAGAAIVFGLAGAILTFPVADVVGIGFPDDISGPLSVPILLIEASPVFAAALLWCALVVFKRDLLPQRTQPEVLVIAVWFVVGLLVLAFAPTRSALSIAYVVVPATILSLRAVEQLLESRRMGLVISLYCVVTFATLWFVVSRVLNLPHSQMQMFMMAAAACGIAVMGLVTMRSQKKRAIVAVQFYKPVMYGSIAVTALFAVFVVIKGNPSTISGGRAVASALHEDTLAVHSFTYLYHARQKADAFNGQLAWYTNGWMTGWRPGFRYVPAAMPPNTVDEDVVGSVRGASWIVYYHPGITLDEQKIVRRVLISQYSAHVETPHYTLYRNR